MSSIAKYHYRGRGLVHTRPYADSAAPLRPLCDSSDLKIGVKSKTDVLQDYDSPAGGVVGISSLIEDVTIDLVLHDLNYANLCLAYQGTSSSVTAGTVTDEVVTVHKGSLSCLAHAGATSVVVKNSDGETTYAAGTDYAVSGAGISILDASSLTDGASVKVSYSYGAQMIVEALISGAIQQSLVFDGINSMMDGKARVVRLWKAQFEAAKEVGLKSDKASSIQLTGRLLRDDTKTGGAVSQYFQETIVP